MDTKTAIRTQDQSLCRYHGIKLIQPRRPIDRIFKNLGIKTIEQHIQDMEDEVSGWKAKYKEWNDKWKK